MGTLNVLLSFAQFGDAKTGDIIVNVSNAKDLRERSLARNPSSRAARVASHRAPKRQAWDAKNFIVKDSEGHPLLFSRGRQERDVSRNVGITADCRPNGGYRL